MRTAVMHFRCYPFEFKVGGHEVNEEFALTQSGKCDPCIGYKCEFESECKAMNQQQSEAA